MRVGSFIRLVGSTAVAVGALTAIAAPSASAGLLSCGAGSQPFAQFGDNGSYFLVPNGGFENGSTGWTLSGGAKVGNGNEPFSASGPGTSSLYLPAGSSALGPRTCVALLTPHGRMFAAAASSSSTLSVQVIFYGLLGNVTGVFNYASMSASGFQEWRPTAKLPSTLALPLLTSYCRIKVTVSGGAWRVDDVYEDPWLSGMI